jgi:hypothetical protein
MKIIFRKHNDGKSSIHCIRNNKTETWMKTDNFQVIHDLMHYAAETTLQIHGGFYSILNSGVDINIFELPKEQRKFQMTREALFAETIVNLLTIEYNQGRFPDFNAILAETCTKNNYPFMFPAVSKDEHDTILQLFEKLFYKWIQLKENNSLELEFPN